MNNNTQQNDMQGLDPNQVLSSLSFMTNLHEQSLPKDQSQQTDPNAPVEAQNGSGTTQPDKTDKTTQEIEQLKSQLSDLEAKLAEISDGAKEAVKTEMDTLKGDIKDALE